MPRARQYIIRGSLTKCIDHMFTHWTNLRVEYLSIIYHDRGKYYCVVNDEFLSQDTYEPEVEGTRLVLRATLKELKKLCTYYHHTQTELGV